MSTSHEQLIKDLLARRGAVEKADHLCRLIPHQKSWGWSRILAGIRHVAPSTSRHQGSGSPSGGTVSLQDLQITSPSGSTQNNWNQVNSTFRGLDPSQQQSANTAINVPRIDQPVVLFGIQGPRITLELAQINTLKYCKDNLFFEALKQQYKQRRGRLRYWFSVWRLSHCDFVKVISNGASLKFLCLPWSVREDMGGYHGMSRQRSTN